MEPGPHRGIFWCLSGGDSEKEHTWVALEETHKKLNLGVKITGVIIHFPNMVLRVYSTNGFLQVCFKSPSLVP